MNIFKNRVAAVGTAAAVLVTLGGVGGAVASSQITSADIQNQTIKSADISAGGVGKSEIRKNAVGLSEINQHLVDYINAHAGKDGTNGVDGKDGKDGIGKDGAPGAPGANGKDGAPGLSEVRADEPYNQVAKANSVSVVFAACPSGKAAISGGFRLNADQSEAFQGGGYAVNGVSVLASEPVGVQGGKVVNTYQNAAFPQDADGRFLPNGWAVTVQNDTNKDQGVRAAVVCAVVQ